MSNMDIDAADNSQPIHGSHRFNPAAWCARTATVLIGGLLRHRYGGKILPRFVFQFPKPNSLKTLTWSQVQRRDFLHSEFCILN
jgi:hypothetical protein